jgi:hypothetical protein
MRACMMLSPFTIIRIPYMLTGPNHNRFSHMFVRLDHLAIKYSIIARSLPAPPIPSEPYRLNLVSSEEITFFPVRIGPNFRTSSQTHLSRLRRLSNGFNFFFRMETSRMQCSRTVDLEIGLYNVVYMIF